ncbi:hypothetical protein D918_00714 [Trichuris suis]|nr:hypothetical protein D918_00714 [Trichuris suis]
MDETQCLTVLLNTSNRSVQQELRVRERGSDRNDAHEFLRNIVAPVQAFSTRPVNILSAEKCTLIGRSTADKVNKMTTELQTSFVTIRRSLSPWNKSALLSRLFPYR